MGFQLWTTDYIACYTISGWIRSTTGSYQIPLLLCTGSQMVAVPFFLLTQVYIGKQVVYDFDDAGRGS